MDTGQPPQLTGRAKGWANLRPWKPGESGRSHPAAKKKTLTEGLLKKLVKKRVNQLTEAILNEAASGNIEAWKEVADRTEGKVAQRIEVSGNVDLGVRIAAARERRRQVPVIDAEVTSNESSVQNLVNSLPSRSAANSEVSGGDSQVDDALDMGDIFRR